MNATCDYFLLWAGASSGPSIALFDIEPSLFAGVQGAAI
jgi:hypothetical protein